MELYLSLDKIAITKIATAYRSCLAFTLCSETTLSLWPLLISPYEEEEGFRSFQKTYSVRDIEQNVALVCTLAEFSLA